MKHETGGPAFPRTAFEGSHKDIAPDFVAGQSGMTLRQWYAGMAMQGLKSNSDWCGSVSETAAYAFEIADAMLTYEQEEKP